MLTASHPQVITCQRIRNGQPVQAELAYVYSDDGDGLPELAILSNWSKRRQEFRDTSIYIVEEIPAGAGRGFLLHRSESDIAADADGELADTHYAVFVSDEQPGTVPNGTCDCKGYVSTSERGFGHCKHLEIMARLIQAGHIDHPGLDPRPEPSPDQLIEAPF